MAPPITQRTAPIYLRWRLLAIALVLVLGCHAHADTVQVAVAANFIAPMELIAQQFEKDTGHRVVLTGGATGQLATQISHGAPWAVFLSADHTTGPYLIAQGHAVAGTHSIYAQGRLALWSADASKLRITNDQLPVDFWKTFQHVAIANPRIAPYGAAAMQVLQRTAGLPPAPDAPAPTTIVQGNSIAQTYQLVATGNAVVGFVALSQIMLDGKILRGSAWIIPQPWYTAIDQGAVLLKQGQQQPAATALLTYLSSPTAQRTMQRFGYSTPSAAKDAAH